MKRLKKKILVGWIYNQEFDDNAIVGCMKKTITQLKKRCPGAISISEANVEYYRAGNFGLSWRGKPIKVRITIEEFIKKGGGVR